MMGFDLVSYKMASSALILLWTWMMPSIRFFKEEHNHSAEQNIKPEDHDYMDLTVDDDNPQLS